MCGIAGIIDFSGNSPQARLQEQIAPMVQRMAHRGPDAEGLWVQDGVALGHRRLSILDLSDAANQPFADVSQRYVIVFNGEIYNYREIKAELKEYPFRTQGDTEVVLAAYLRYGESCVDHLNGMFAFAIWDHLNKKLFLARDRMGIKPLYYHLKGDFLCFASEMSALLTLKSIPRRLQGEALTDYLRYNTVHAPYTLLHEVKQMMPGSLARFDQKGWHTRRYWSMTHVQNGHAYDKASVQKEVKRLLQAAVDRRLISDVPLGAFLSGGIDSSAIVALMASVSEQPVNTFSVVFNEKAYDESPYSAQIAKKYRTVHTPILLKPEDFLAELPAALKAMDTPSGDGINSYVVSQRTKAAGITVALSGLGGDELFAGYPVFKQWTQLYPKRWLWKAPVGIRKALGRWGSRWVESHKASRWAELMGLSDLAFTQAYPVFRKLNSNAEISALNPKLSAHQNAVGVLLKSYESELGSFPLLSQVSVGEISSYTQNVLLRDTDQMSMAHALEVRVPFFDHTLVEYMLKVPDEIKYPNYTKELLVSALGDMLPEEIVHRPKMGFVFPWSHWLKHELKDFCAARIDRLAERGLMQSAVLFKLWQDFLGGNTEGSWLKIWMLVVLEEWLENKGI